MSTMHGDQEQRMKLEDLQANAAVRGILSDGLVTVVMYCPRVLGQWFDGIRFYAAASSPRRSRRTWAGLR